jgi:phosphoglycolate phosphatase-like HAD superfamily hydrolase
MTKKIKNLIVFDMDGVIVDVSQSYRDTVRQTARLFFKGASDWERLPDPLFSLHDLAGIKQSGGLNNDWELTYHILDLLLKQVDIPELSHETNPWLLHQLTLQGCKLEKLATFLASHASPLGRLSQEVGEHRNPFIQKMSSNDVGSGNIIKQIFQEIYLGQALFQSTYGRAPKIHTGEGLINREALLIEPAVFQALASENLLALATGRPGAEAHHALNHFKIRSYFASVFSLDDCILEENRLLERDQKTVSLSKPHPFMLDALGDMHANMVSGLYYIGDMPDDMVAAKRSVHGYTGIGMVTSAKDKTKLYQALLTAGAEHVIRNITELQPILTQPNA